MGEHKQRENERHRERERERELFTTVAARLARYLVPSDRACFFRTIEWEFLQSQEHISSHIVVALDVTGCGCGNWAVGDILAGLPACLTD